MAVRLLSFWNAIFLGAMLVSGHSKHGGLNEFCAVYLDPWRNDPI